MTANTIPQNDLVRVPLLSVLPPAQDVHFVLCQDFGELSPTSPATIFGEEHIVSYPKEDPT